MKTKQEMIDFIYDKVAGRFYGNTLEVNLNNILNTLYNRQDNGTDWKQWEDNSQFP